MPPIIADEMEDLNPAKNPAFEYATSRQWLAYNTNRIVGRIAAIKHHIEFENEKKIRFGWIDFIDDHDVSKALIETVEDWASELGASIVHGPLGFNDFDFEGMLVEGFDSMATIATIYNYPYYPKHLEKLGYAKACDWLEFNHSFVKGAPPERLQSVSSYLSKRYSFKLVKLQSKKDFYQYIDRFFDAVNDSYKSLYGYHALTPAEAQRIKKKYFSYLSPKFVSIVVNQDDDIIAFAITMPSLSNAYKRARGHLFPFGFIHLLKALKKTKVMDLYLIGARPEYQSKGVVAMIFNQIWENFSEMGVDTLRFNPTLESNTRLFKIWNSIYPGDFLVDDQIKRRRCYSRNILET